MYQPNFCVECGTRITRARWHFWTTRRFCTTCAPRFRKAQTFKSLIAGAILFSIGLMAGRAARPTAPPLIIERAQLSAPGVAKSGAGSSITNSNITTPKPDPTYGPDGTVSERPTELDEVVYICGARTKKGAPCQRRVRGPGRCWQHKGLPAMLPPEKLVVKG